MTINIPANHRVGVVLEVSAFGVVAADAGTVAGSGSLTTLDETGLSPRMD